jgi:hypothetical protein
MWRIGIEAENAVAPTYVGATGAHQTSTGKELSMRRTRQLTEMLFIGGVVAMAGWLFVAYGLFHTLVMIALVAGLIGSYVLRRHARLALVYNRSRHAAAPGRYRGDTGDVIRR